MLKKILNDQFYCGVLNTQDQMISKKKKKKG